MPEEILYSWRVKIVAAVVLFLAFVGLDLWSSRYAAVIQDGNLTRVVVIGRVIDLNSGDILYMQDGSVKAGKILSSDMYGNIEFLDSSGEILQLKKGRGAGEVRETLEDQDQIVTLRLLTWPKELRRQGVNFKGAVVVAGNRFQARYLDRVLRIGDRLFVELPMRRLDRIEQVELREYFRTPYLLRLTMLLVVATVLVGGVKGLLTLAATGVSVAVLLAAFIPGLLGRTVQAAQSAGWIIGGAIAVTGVLWSLRSLWDPEVRTTVWGLMLRRWKRLAAWLGVGALGGAAMALAVRLIGQRPVPLALLIALVATFLTFVIITGYSPKVVSGSLGTVGGLIVCALISWIASKALWFTGLAVELGYLELGTALWRDPVANRWPFQEFLTAGLIIAALGAMMDVSMSVSSTIYEVKRVNPNISVLGAFRSGYNVGRDIMSTMTDTLIFAFIGADLIFIVMPGLIFPEGGRLYPFMRMLNMEETAVEAIHALTGTLGLVLAIPISAAIAAVLTARYRPRTAYAQEPKSPSRKEGDDPPHIEGVET